MYENMWNSGTKTIVYVLRLAPTLFRYYKALANAKANA
jgi:hypothetical protein